MRKLPKSQDGKVVMDAFSLIVRDLKTTDSDEGNNWSQNGGGKQKEIVTYREEGTWDKLIV